MQLENKKLVNLVWFLLLSSLLIMLSYQYADQAISLYIYKHAIAIKIPGLHYFSMLGKNVIAALFCIIFILYARFFLHSSKHLWQGIYLFSCVLLSNALCLVLKIAFGRARPMEWLLHDHYGFFGPNYQPEYWSFPSGHSISSMSLVFGLCFIFPRLYKFFLIVGLLLIASRVLLLRHYLSDVLAASLIAYCISYALYRAYFYLKITSQDSF